MQPVDGSTYDASDPFGHVRPNGKKHTGSDWGVGVGTVVVAVQPGTIVAVENNPGNGLCIAQTLPNGNFWSYIHLSESAVNVGQQVSEGQPLALSGNSGTNSGGAHLHCSYSDSPRVYLGEGNLQDPWVYLNSLPTPVPPIPTRKKKNMFAMAAIKGESYVWAVWAPGFYYEIKSRPGLSTDEVSDQMRKWNAQVVNSQPNFIITRTQANEIKAMCLK